MTTLSTEGTDSAEEFDRALALVGAGASARAVAKVVISATAFGTTALAVRLLGVTGYGALAFGLSMVGLAAAITAGFGIAATRTLASKLAVGDRKGATEVTRGLITLVVAGGALGLLLLLSLITMTQSQLGPKQRIALGFGLGLLLIGHSAGVAGGAVARGFGRVVMMELPGIVEVLSKFLLVVLLFALGIAGLGAIAAGYGAAGVAAAIAAVGITRRAHAKTGPMFRPAFAAAHELLRTTGPYAAAVVATTLIQRLDVAVLGATHPGGPVGSYAPTISLVQSLVMLPAILLSAVFVTAATRLVETGYGEGFSKLYLTVCSSSILIAMPAFMLLAIAPIQVLRFLFGEQFPAAPGVVYVLLIGFFVTVALGLNGQALIASGERRLLARAFVWPGIVMVVSSLALIPSFSALGAAVATTISLVTLNVSMSWNLHRATGVHPFHRNLLLLIGTAPLPICVALALHRATARGLWAAVFLSLVTWSGWVLLMRFLRAFQFAELRGLLPSRSHFRIPDEAGENDG